MNAVQPAPQGAVTVWEAAEFIWAEADLLDARLHDEWLELWRPEGLYVIPIEPDAEDFEASLNYAYDDETMRRARVQRLGSKHSMSVVAAARTNRTLSRFRILQADDDRATVRCAQHLVESKRGEERLYAADVTYELARHDGGLKLLRKVVRLINSTEALGGIAYLL